MKISITVLFVLSFGLLQAQTKQPTIAPEIPIQTLHAKGIVPIISNYKVGYYKAMPYLFYNEQDTFNELQGDFYNVKHTAIKDLNIMVGYWKKYGKEKQSLIVLVSLSKSSAPVLKNTAIKVVSSKHGVFEPGTLESSELATSQQQQLFVKKLELANDRDVINKIFDDVITVSVGDQNYTFLNPELRLD